MMSNTRLVKNPDKVEEILLKYLDQNGFLPPGMPIAWGEYFLKKYPEKMRMELIGVSETKETSWFDETHIYCKNHEGRLFDILKEGENSLSIKEIQELPECKFLPYEPNYLACAVWDNESGIYPWTDNDELSTPFSVKQILHSDFIIPLEDSAGLDIQYEQLHQAGEIVNLLQSFVFPTNLEENGWPEYLREIKAYTSEEKTKEEYGENEEVRHVNDAKKIEEILLKQLEQNGFLPAGISLEWGEYFLKKYPEKIRLELIGMNETDAPFEGVDTHFYCKNHEGRLFDVIDRDGNSLDIKEIEFLPNDFSYTPYGHEYLSCAIWSNAGNTDIWQLDNWSNHKIYSSNVKIILHSDFIEPSPYGFSDYFSVQYDRLHYFEDTLTAPKEFVMPQLLPSVEMPEEFKEILACTEPAEQEESLKDAADQFRKAHEESTELDLKIEEGKGLLAKIRKFFGKEK